MGQQLCAEADQKPLVLPVTDRTDTVEAMIYRLFELHDLNKNGVLEEEELIQLNKKISMLHHGKEIDRDEVKAIYQNLFRTELHPEGRPINYKTFRTYVIKLLSERQASSANEREMILDQWTVEAVNARLAFHNPSLESIDDAPFLSTISFDEDSALERYVTSPAKQVPRHVWCNEDDMLTTPSTAASPRGSVRTDPSSPGSPGSPLSPGADSCSSQATSPGNPCSARSLSVTSSTALRKRQADPCPALEELPRALAEWGRRCERQLGKILMCVDEDTDADAEE